MPKKNPYMFASKSNEKIKDSKRKPDDADFKPNKKRKKKTK
jgi:hypothetical protein